MSNTHKIQSLVQLLLGLESMVFSIRTNVLKLLEHTLPLLCYLWMYQPMQYYDI
jgi:hypothetical protein